MNILNVSIQHSISTLAANGWSRRRIARELGINRETVGRYLRVAQSKPAIPLTGEGAKTEAKPAISLTGSEADLVSKPAISLTGSAGRQSLCTPLQEVIEKAIEAGLLAQRIYQDLVGGHGFVGSYHSVQRFVRQLRATEPIPFLRMEVAAGQEAQVDFGQGAWVIEKGKRKRPHLFRIVLSHSRKAYSEVVWHQTTENFIRCLENAFRYFGGVPHTLVIDNLRAAVTRADWFDPELNYFQIRTVVAPKFQPLALAGFMALFCFFMGHASQTRIYLHRGIGAVPSTAAKQAAPFPVVFSLIPHA